MQFGKYANYSTSLLGDLDEVILLNAALTPDQISQFSARRVKASDDNRIISLWHFDEKSGTKTADSSTNANTACFFPNPASSGQDVQWITSPVPSATPS